MKTILQKKNSRRAVSPVIATLLLVAIAVIGGALIFAFAQGYFTSSQISGRPSIEQFEITGYDARETGNFTLHDGNGLDTSGLITNVAGGINAGDPIVVYLESKSPQKITITELILAGSPYVYVPGTGATMDTDTPAAGEFSFVADATSETVSDATAAELGPGQAITLFIGVDEDIQDGRDVQLKLTTGNGAVLVGTIVAGQQEG